jgi:glycerophosphoryl diester phosphodiesterase
MRCIGFAHRGAAADAPENTLPAFALALELGATGLESDVWLTADRIAVLDHDGRGPGGRPIHVCARAELAPHVPTLADLYTECGRDFELSLDVKDPDAAPAVVRVARRAGAEGRLWLCHWSWRVVAPWRGLSESVRLVDSTRLAHMRTPPGARAERMVALDLDALNLHWSDWSPALAQTFRAAGRKLLAWDVQDESSLRAMLELGVDGVFSDHVARMMAVLGDSGNRAGGPVV